MGILRGMEIGAAFFAAAGLFAGCSDGDGQEIRTTREISIDSSESIRAMLDSSGSVNVRKLQSALDSFDIENDFAPYIIARNEGNGEAQSWTLTYGTGAGLITGNTIATGITNGFDAINKAMDTLPADRTTKLRISVESDIYSGEPGSASSSAIKDITNLYSIECENYSILDFNGNTIYANCENAQDIVPVSLTNRNHISIRNLKISGHARYAIWCQGCDNVVFDNITLDMDEKSALGLRIAEKNNTWSRNVFVDNITVTGCQDNAVETMKVDGILIGQIDATDCNDCGLLLNTTTNAVVGTVNGTRCSPRSSNGVYAALRTANFVGPDVYIHNINAEECGRGYFSVSANCGINIDEITSTNSYAQAILVQDTQNLRIKKATLTGGSHNSDTAVRFTNGSAGGSLPVMNNTLENVTISGYAKPIVEDSEKSDWNDFINCTIEGGTFSANSATSAREAHTEGTLEIPEGTTQIADGEYMNYTNITSVTIPASVTTIGANAFYGCGSLKTVTFAEGSACETIGDCAFGKTAVESISFPASVKSFGSNILSPSCALVTINSTEITSMGTEAFFNLADPSTIKFADSALSSGKTYDKGKYGDETWGKYWYGYTRSTIE